MSELPLKDEQTSELVKEIESLRVCLSMSDENYAFYLTALSVYYAKRSGITKKQMIKMINDNYS